MSWLRRNRWWLLALPMALALALASGAYRVMDFWYEDGWHRVDATVEQGEFVTTHATVYTFDKKPEPAALRVRLASVHRGGDPQTSLGYGLDMPPDAVGVQLRLDFESVQEKPAPYCTVFVVDADGNRYSVAPNDGGTNPCPHPGFMSGDTTAPETWSRTVVAVVPNHATVEYVWVGVTWPDYVRFRLEPPRRATELPAVPAEQQAGADR